MTASLRAFPLVVLATLGSFVIALSSCVQGGDADDGGDAGGTPCERLQAKVVSCLDDFCSGGGSSAPFCACWTRGQDVETQSCTCTARNPAAYCEQTTLSKFNCDNLQTSVEPLCR